MRERGTPRYENDDFSSFAGPDYVEKSFLGRGPKNYHRSDDRIYEEVCEALLDDSSVDASDIGMKVEEGVVTLEGHARDRMEKRLAEMLACDVPGVVDVRNEITLS